MNSRNKTLIYGPASVVCYQEHSFSQHAENESELYLTYKHVLLFYKA